LIRVYRVCSVKHPNIDGEGSRLYGGRWNSPGLPVVYTASSLALAILETRVHLKTPPVDYIRLTIEIDNKNFTPEDLTSAVFGSVWRTNTSVTRKLGDLHFRANPLVPLKVPSVVVDTEWNLLFHPDWGGSHAVVIDKRL
jgi:RES domain-containing protein